MTCAACGAPLVERINQGRARRRFCDRQCSQQAGYRRRRGLPELLEPAADPNGDYDRELYLRCVDAALVADGPARTLADELRGLASELLTGRAPRDATRDPVERLAASMARISPGGARRRSPSGPPP